MNQLLRPANLARRVAVGISICAAAALIGSQTVGCGDSGTGDTAGSGGAAASGTGGTAGTLIVPDGGSGGMWEGGDETSVCAAQTATGELRSVYLAFAFDVSGSMGQLDYPWHDPALKWDPVVTATESFFADPASAGISASLTFFPAESDICLPSTYSTPDVPMTALPSNAFEAAITAITPQVPSDWRGGTPTLAVVSGTFEFLDGLSSANPNGVYALVLVTDGYPQGCGDGNGIPAVVDEATSRAGTIRTYVIGVENPPLPGAPSTLSDLHAIAAAGGTSQAFIIATGDPEATKTSFSQAINDIRGQAVSCEITIPPPPGGQVFDRSKVTVSYSGDGGASTTFVYDPDCGNADSWHYDDPANPTSIVLCPQTCETVMSDPNAEIDVEFGCVVVIDIQ